MAVVSIFSGRFPSPDHANSVPEVLLTHVCTCVFRVLEGRASVLMSSEIVFLHNLFYSLCVNAYQELIKSNYPSDSFSSKSLQFF